MAGVGLTLMEPVKLLEFLKFAGKLKALRRTGWVKNGIENPETVAGHMYRMGVMSMVINDPQLDMNKCLRMSLVHDLAESIVGDITPHCGVSDEEKHKKETEAMESLTSLLDPSVGKEVQNLFQEFEAQATAEAMFVRDLDRFDMILQAFEYEEAEKRPDFLQEFFSSTVDKFRHPSVRELVTELIKQRAERASASIGGSV
ncbi:unnamed protein product [Darwinula stevensoni]|uniref:5'-deoxynucleotidase HDDC2 n=1 Tax=Darwinula stevensoni TaxID=69355 RepID=A0A7R8XAR6_9CRUS|nr:unnamed protein product [Darwinula stevensoni]CAG0891646.1 unnamed protein product [Darwinula stevensoni]